MSVVDSNILVYATSAWSPFNERSLTALIQLTLSESVTVPRQVLREYVCVMTRGGPSSKPVPMSVAMRAVDRFEQMFKVLEGGPAVWAEFKKLCASHDFAGKQVHDANIVATMLAHGETKLLTLNIKDFRRFVPLIELLEP